jgi:uncharacterized membrane protein YbhN (UPF0104 family)
MIQLTLPSAALTVVKGPLNPCWRRSTFSVMMLLAMAGVIQYLLGWENLLAPWRHADSALLALAVLLMLISYGLRAWRVHDYFRPLPGNSFKRCLKLTLLHNLFNNLLPFRAGEASFPFLMRRYFALPLSRTTAALLWFRLLDLHVIGGVILMITTERAGWPAVAFAGVLGVWVLALWWLFHCLRRSLLAPVFQRLGQRGHSWLDQVRAGLPCDPVAFWRAWAWTALNWLVKLAAFAVILQALTELPLLIAVAGALGGELTSVLPIHGIAGLGTYEAGVVAALLPFRIQPASAIAAAVNMHLFLLGSCVLGGALATWLRGGHDSQ